MASVRRDLKDDLNPTIRLEFRRMAILKEVEEDEGRRIGRGEEDGYIERSCYH